MRVAAVVLCACLGIVRAEATSIATERLLVELVHGDLSVRLEFGGRAGEAIATIGDVSHHLDLGGGTIDGRLVDLAQDRPTGFRVEQWYGGPVIAGYGTAFSMLRLDDTLCAEIANVRWMLPFLESAIEAIDLLERARLVELAVPSSACGPVPFTIYASHGWPMLVGRAGETLFRTTRIDFNHALPPAIAPLDTRK